MIIFKTVVFAFIFLFRCAVSTKPINLDSSRITEEKPEGQKAKCCTSDREVVKITQTEEMATPDPIDDTIEEKEKEEVNIIQSGDTLIVGGFRTVIVTVQVTSKYCTSN
jgi:hypothetical protein